MKLKCPNNKNHREFSAVAVEMHDWKVGSFGEFIEDLGCTEVHTRPRYGENITTCLTCGAEAVVED